MPSPILRSVHSFRRSQAGTPALADFGIIPRYNTKLDFSHDNKVECYHDANLDKFTVAETSQIANMTRMETL